MVSHINYKALNANENFVMFLTFKLITCYTDGELLHSESITFLLGGSEHICWILDLEGEVHSIWDMCTSIFQEYKGNTFFGKSSGTNNTFWAG